MAATDDISTASAPGEASDPNQELGGVRTLIREGATGLAINVLDQIAARAPERGDVHVLKGVALEREDRLAEARAEFSLAAKLLPTLAEPMLREAIVAGRQGRTADELGLLRAAVGVDPKSERVWRRILDLEWQARDYASAAMTVSRILEFAPNDMAVVVRAAWCLFNTGRKDDAIAAMAERLGPPESLDHGCVIAWSEMMVDREDRNREGAARLKRLCEEAPGAWSAWACYGKVLHKLDRIDAAVDALHRAVELAPGQAVCWFDLGVAERQRGRTAELEAALSRALELDPFSGPALRIFGYEHRHAYGDPVFRKVNRAVARLHRYSKDQQVEVLYAAAKAFEDVDEIDTAFEHYARAGALQKQLVPWSERQMNGVLSVLKRYATQDDMAMVRSQGIQTQLPVFVFGMPRSGTSLIEQVIASHPEVYGAGELKLGAAVINGLPLGRVMLETTFGVGKTGPNYRHLTIAERGQTYLDELREFADGDYARIVDKMPGNYFWVGLLQLLLPGAFFIHSRRHPVDTCLSQYKILFPDGIPHTYDLRDLGIAYRQYDQFVRYWCSVMPKGSVLHVRYEDMITDLDGQARAMIDFIDLPWDDACLRFYENKRAVKTASVSQVRQPVYAGSVGRWRKYEPYLKPLIDELGPLITEYEDELEGRRPSPFV